jgi:uncharacterized Tic20 family protein
LVTSALVWATQRFRSRFLVVQALQALLFQLCALLCRFLTFGLFVVGANLVVFSGRIARASVGGPRLLAFLGGIMVLGSVSIFLFQFTLPLWGVWAALRILRGRHHRYPVLGRLAINWSSRWSVSVEASPDGELSAEELISETVLAGLAHLSVLGALSPILAPILWATVKHRSRFLTHHLLQAALFQLSVAGLGAVFFFGVLPTTMLLRIFGKYLPFGLAYPVVRIVDTAFPFGFTGILVLLGLLFVLLVLVAAIRAFKGKEYHYPIIGTWLIRYLNTELVRPHPRRG